MNKIKLILVGIIIILLMPTTLAGLGDSYRTTSYNIVEIVYLNSIQPEILDDAVAEIEQMIKDGEPRWEVAKRAATIADVQITNLNSEERMTIPSNWLSVFGRSKQQEAFQNWWTAGGDIEQYDSVSEWVWENQVGQCSENANLVYYLLKEARVEDVRIHVSNRANHGLVVWGMGNRDPSKPESWTDEVIIPDSWQHYVLRGKAAFNNGYAGCTYDTDSTYPGKDKRACGYGGRPCCKKIDPCRSSALVCLNDKCYGCGYEDKYCCKDEKCNEGLECNTDGKCVKKEKDTSAGDTSGGEFDCPIPKGAKHIVTDYKDYWIMPEDGRKVGPHVYHDTEKTKKMSFSCYNAEGKLHGVYRRWNKDGTLVTERHYKDGQSHGVNKRWNNDGTLVFEFNYKEDKLHGVYRR
jgi:ribosomal protein S7